MNWAANYLIKSAARTRQMAREGKLSPETISKLQAQGYLPSPERVAKGLHTGSVNIAKQMGIGGVPERLSGSIMDRMGETLAGEVQMPFNALHPQSIKQYLADPGRYGWGKRLRIALSGGEGALREALDELKTTPGGVVLSEGVQKMDDVPGFLKWLYRLDPDVRMLEGMSDAQIDQLRAIRYRHEVDELRELARAARKGRFVPDDISHAGPSVLRRETSNLSMLDPEIKKRWGILRHPDELAFLEGTKVKPSWLKRLIYYLTHLY